MRRSRHSVLLPLGPDPRVTAPTLWLQPLTGQAALLEPAEAALLLRLEGEPAAAAGLPLARLQELGFLVADDAHEARLLADARQLFAAELAKTPTQLLVVPTLGCNLRCRYCYQEGAVTPGGGLLDEEQLASLFAFLDAHHLAAKPRPYLTLFGGEPLLDTPRQRALLQRFFALASQRGLEVAVVTNGYELAAYLPLLASHRVREVQVTLDGPQPLHDQRRPHGSGRGSYQQVVEGIDLLLAAGLRVNLRVVVDRENLPALPDLARLAEQRGWLDAPAGLFQTQLGRNYELFSCTGQRQADPSLLYDRLTLWADYLRLAAADPLLRRFHTPRLHGLRHLAEQGELPPPLFDGCPATKKEWAFGPDGGIYGCTATVGHPAHRLGSYHPTVQLDEERIARWRGRSVFTIPECAGCEVAAFCGGGCGALAAELHDGEVRAPDCRPIRELLTLGARFFELAAPPAPPARPSPRVPRPARIVGQRGKSGPTSPGAA
ncbi:MAG: radical SAM protein [Myxococcota bacterium]|nr:radical SAM protein [Myxococcota bacterium]